MIARTLNFAECLMPMARALTTVAALALAGAVLVALAEAAPASVRSAPAAVATTPGHWGPAIEVPALATLNSGHNAHLQSMWCASAGNCGAGGYYTRRGGYREAFVLSETRGRWGPAIEVPGTTTLNAGGYAGATSVSCPRPGDCVAGGYYTDRYRHQQAFVVTQTNGRWGKAFEVPGTAALNAEGLAAVNAVSCGFTGNCTVGGEYSFAPASACGFNQCVQAFVANEVNGRWQAAHAVPGLAQLNTGMDATVDAISCTPNGNCAAGGEYTQIEIGEAFVVTETAGHWHDAQEVTGLPELYTGQYAYVTAVSCASPGNCAAGGSWRDPDYVDTHAFVLLESHGHWGKAITPRASRALGGATSLDAVSAISCPSPGDCAAGGGSTVGQGYLVSARNGVWGIARVIPGLSALSPGAGGVVDDVSCSRAGACGAGGGYGNSSTSRAFVVSEAGGGWGEAEEVPGTRSPYPGAEVDVISCPAVRTCSAGGSYTDSKRGSEVFVVSETP
jgi:hypothetical protein